MPHPAFVEAMRRVVSGENSEGRSLVVIDGPPSGEIGAPGLGGLYEIWHEAASGAIDAKDATDRGEKTPILSPAAGNVKVRWFQSPAHVLV